MSSTIKRQNHRIHPCNTARKTELLNFVISQNPARSILIVTSNDSKTIDVAQTKEITIVSDNDLAQPSETMYDIVISYDLPDKAIIYMTRYARAKEFAIILLGSEDQKNLYAIETLFGRTITQEPITGFEPNFGIAVEQKNKEEMAAQRAKREEERNAPRPKREFKPRRDDARPDFKREDRGPRDDKRPERKPYEGNKDDSRGEFKPRRDDARPEFKREDRGPRDDNRPARKPYEGNKTESKSSNPWDKKARPTEFLGKDENGKPIFGTKTRERNHYIDGTPRSDADKFAKTAYVNKPKFFGEHDKAKKNDEGKKPFNPERKPYEGKQAFNKDDKRPYEEKKPFGDKKPFADKKPYGDKKPFGEKKPYGDNKSYGEKKSYDSKPSYDRPKPAHTDTAPKRAPRRISVKSLKPSEDKQQ
ncbi:MAG: hypothetical protein Q8S36_07465 [Sulfuricurvum sp.]|nr:hypothetical protein [Sulfuricurvum sp.]